MNIRFRFLAILALTLLAAGIAGATTFTVTNTNDAGVGSLRGAITAANANNTATPGSPHIINATGISGTISLLSELPFLNNHISINGPGAVSLTISRSGAVSGFGIFTVNPSKAVTLAGMTVSNGSRGLGGGILNDGGVLTVTDCRIVLNAAGRGGGIYNDEGRAILTNTSLASIGVPGGNGGSIYNYHGTMTLTGCTVSGTFIPTSGSGGGIYNDSGTVAMVNTTVSGNSVDNGLGGGIFNDHGTLSMANSIISSNDASLLSGGGGGIATFAGTVTLINSTITDNSSGIGGGIYSAVTSLTITNCTFSDNRAATGGGIRNISLGELAVTNCTFFGNSGFNGGGISMGGGKLALVNCTISGNSSDNGGGLYTNGGNVTSRNTIFAGNTISGSVILASRDVAGAVSSQGHNIIGDTTNNPYWIASDLLGIDPDLDSLRDNGGPTRTMALACGSPAIDAGDNTDAPSTDQRGESRIVDGDCDGAATIDIGAYERAASTPTIVLASSAIELSPVNHNYHTVDVSDFVSSVTNTADACSTFDVDDVVIVRVTSDEPEDANGGGDGNTRDDIAIAGNCRSVQLRAERDGGGNGRVYRIFVATGCAGEALASFKVSVRKGNGAAVEGSVAYTETSTCTIAPKQIVQVPDAQYSLSLMESYPNPFNTSTVIGYSIGTAGHVRLTVFDITGHTVATLVDEVETPGEYSMLFNSGDLPNGTYYYVLESNGEQRTGSMVLTK